MTDKKTRLRRTGAPAPDRRTAGSASAPTAPPIDSDISLALDRTLLLRLKRLALERQAGQGGRRVTQREIVEHGLREFLDGKGPSIDFNTSAREESRSTGTMSIDRSLMLRIKYFALGQEEHLKRRVTQREVIEHVVEALLKEAGIPDLPVTASEPPV